MKLLVFNGSGTLFKSQKSGFNTVASELGKTEEAEEQEKEYKGIRKKGPWGLDVLAKLYSGVSEKEINEKSQKFVNNYLVESAKGFVDKIKGNGFKVVCYSSELFNIMEDVKERLGLDDVCGNVLEIVGGKSTGNLKEKVDRNDRAERLRKFIEANNLDKEDVFIVGDSVTAVPSSKYGVMIAINPKDEEIKGASAYEITDLNELLDILK